MHHMNERDRLSFEYNQMVKDHNRGAKGSTVLKPKMAFSRLLTPSLSMAHCARMNGFLAICCICREIMS